MTLDDTLDDLIQQPEMLKQMLAEPGRSQAGLARRLGLDTSGVNRLVNGGRQLKAKEVAEIRAYLEATTLRASNHQGSGARKSAMVERIDGRLNELGLTAITAATRRDLPRDTIRNVLRSDSNPRADTLVAIADALQTTVGWLLGETGVVAHPVAAPSGGLAPKGEGAQLWNPFQSSPGLTVRSGGKVTLDIKAEVSVGVAAQILGLIEGDKP